MGRFKKKEEGDVYKVESLRPADPNNTRVVYAPTREVAEQHAEALRLREKDVNVKKVR